MSLYFCLLLYLFNDYNNYYFFSSKKGVYLLFLLYILFFFIEEYNYLFELVSIFDLWFSNSYENFYFLIVYVSSNLIVLFKFYFDYINK